MRAVQVEEAVEFGLGGPLEKILELPVLGESYGSEEERCLPASIYDEEPSVRARLGGSTVSTRVSRPPPK